MPSCKRCLTCDVSWPSHPGFGLCPACGKATHYRVGEADETLRRALELRNVYKAEYLYQEREKEREARGEPTPEDIGAIEGREAIAQIRALERLVA